MPPLTETISYIFLISQIKRERIIIFSKPVAIYVFVSYYTTALHGSLLSHKKHRLLLRNKTCGIIKKVQAWFPFMDSTPVLL